MLRESAANVQAAQAKAGGAKPAGRCQGWQGMPWLLAGRPFAFLPSYFTQFCAAEEKFLPSPLRICAAGPGSKPASAPRPAAPANPLSMAERAKAAEAAFTARRNAALLKAQQKK